MENDAAAARYPTDPQGRPTPAELLGDIETMGAVEVWLEIRRLGLDPSVIDG